MMTFFHAPKCEAPVDGSPSPWEPFENRTHNGRYWALHRWNDKWFGRIQVMNTKGGQPRRFGSMGSAQKAADTENTKAGLPA